MIDTLEIRGGVSPIRLYLDGNAIGISEAPADVARKLLALWVKEGASVWGREAIFGSHADAWAVWRQTVHESEARALRGEVDIRLVEAVEP